MLSIVLFLMMEKISSKDFSRKTFQGLDGAIQVCYCYLAVTVYVQKNSKFALLWEVGGADSQNFARD